MNIYQMARQRMAGVDFIATRSHAAEVALAHKAELNRKWREANPDKMAAMRERDREREKTPERKAMHKAWAQSPSGKESGRRRGAKYYASDDSEWKSKYMHRVCDTCFMPMEVKNPFYKEKHK